MSLFVIVSRITVLNNEKSQKKIVENPLFSKIKRKSYLRGNYDIWFINVTIHFVCVEEGGREGKYDFQMIPGVKWGDLKLEN